VHAVRRHDDPRRLVPRLPELRQHQRLQLARAVKPGGISADICRESRPDRCVAGIPPGSLNPAQVTSVTQPEKI
jgi:hypothetical protein